MLPIRTWPITLSTARRRCWRNWWQIEWDKGNEFFPPTSMQIANVKAGTGSNNVIPGDIFVQFNFRFSTELTDEMIKSASDRPAGEIPAALHRGLVASGQPFLTQRGKLVDAVVNAIEHYNEIKPQLLTNGRHL